MSVANGLQAQSKDADRLDAPIRELLQAHCWDCHDRDEPEAGLDLTHFKTIGSVRRDAAIWKQVSQRVALGNMPPPDFGEMSDEERQTLVEWIDRTLHELDCSDARSPGAVTIRRLNRREYRHTVADTLLVDYQPADDFPGDDVGYGFDNIGDVLSLPPLLMEKYLQAAESISREVILAPEDALPKESTLALSRWQLGQGVRFTGERLHFFSNGGAEFSFDSSRSQEVTFRIHAMGQQAGPEPVRFSFYVDRQAIGSFEITTHEERESFEVTVRLRKGPRQLRLTFDNDYYQPNAENPRDRDRNLGIEQVTLVLENSAEEKPAAHHHFFLVQPSSDASSREAARRLTSAWASRLYRRVVQPDEVDRLLTVYDAERGDGGSFERGMQGVLQAMLVSPHFLYKVEAPCPADGAARPLTNYELATNLAYFLWNGPPDVALLRVAHREDLQDERVLRREFERLVADDKFLRLADDFAEQWLHLRLLARWEPDTELFAGTDRALLDDMCRETLLFCRDVFERNASVMELIGARHTFVNRRLAEHYGLPAEALLESGFHRVEWPVAERGGLMTQGSILTLTSNPTRTSPVKRGRWILENLLGEPPPPPPADAQPLEEQALTGSLREQLEQHRQNPACATCHEQMDGLGFALEHFDAVGRWRQFDGELPIDASGELPGGLRFEGAAELRELLATARRDQFVHCLVEKMLTYALGRGLDYRDHCAVREIAAHVAAEDFRAREVIWGIVNSEPFRHRQLKGE